MTREQKIAEAKRLRKQGLTYVQIAGALGSTSPTVQRWCKPDHAERQRQKSREWKDRNRERNRAADRAYGLRPENLANCSRCDAPMNCSPGTRRLAATPVCAVCRSELRRERCDQIVAWWAEGLSLTEIASGLGWTRNHLAVEMDRMRTEGYDLPYRYGRNRAHKFPQLHRTAA